MSTTEDRRISRRTFLRGVGALGVGGVLVACAPAGAPAGDTGSGGDAAKEGVEIQYWAFWTQLGNVKEQFEATEELQAALGDNTWDFRTGVDQEARLTAVAAGTPPDIGALSNYFDFMTRGAVIPLDDYIEASDVVSEDKFIPGNWEVVQFEGKIYGVPANECFVRRGLNYNTRMVEEAGLDPDSPPETWAETFAWHEALTKFDDAGNLIQFGLDPYDAEGGVGGSNDGWYLAESWGLDYFNPDTGEFNLDNPLMAEGLETMGEFVKLVGPDNLVGMRGVEGQGTWGGAFNAEVQAMIIEGYWHPGETANEKPEIAEFNRASWVPVPEARRGEKLQFGGGHMVQMFKDAKHHDEAWPIAEWLQTKSCNDIIFDNIGWLPAYIPYFEQSDPSAYPGLDFYFQSVTDATQWDSFVRNPIFSFLEQKYVDVREAVYRGEMTGAEAAAKLQDEAVKEYKAAGFAG